MEALRIEILNRKALQLIRDMQDLKLIRVTEDPAAKAKAYLRKMRRNAKSSPSLAEIAKVVDEVRTKRRAKK